MIYDRVTLAVEVACEGLGLHSGEPVSVRLIPSESGIKFFWSSQSWDASPENVTDTSRCTRLGSISTIEHLMSALAGLEITDLDVELTAPEMPALGGSARAYVELLRDAPRTVLGQAEIEPPFSRVFLQENDMKLAVSAGNGRWRYEFKTGDRWPHEMVFETENVISEFADQIAPARTFGFLEEIEMIRKAGLARGLDIESALILGPEGYVNEPLYPDEPPRHKLLDAMGDIYLAGVPLRFLNFVGERSGHTANVKAARQLKDARLESA